MTHACALQVPEKQRLLHIEFLRVLAIFLVLFNHSEGFGYFAVLTNPPRQMIACMISIFSKIAVPLFFMISGALLLGKQEPVLTVLKKRVSKFLMVLLLVSGVYGLFHMRVDGWTLDLLGWVNMIYGNEMHFTLWYLYAYIGFVTMLPLLRRLAQSMSEEEYLYLAGMGLLFSGILPIGEFLLFQGSIHMNTSLQGAVFVASNMLYPLMGYYFEHVMSKKWFACKGILISLTGTVLALSAAAAVTVYKLNTTGLTSSEEIQSFHNSLIAVPAYGAYVCAKGFFDRVKVPNVLRKALTTAGGAVFGVYLFEYLFRYAMAPVEEIVYRLLPGQLGNLMWLGILLAVGVAVVSILKKIPLLGKLI